MMDDRGVAEVGETRWRPVNMGKGVLKSGVSFLAMVIATGS